MLFASTTILQALIQRVRAGHADARAELVSQSYDRLRRFAHNFLRADCPDLRTLQTTQDVLHESLLRVLRDLERFEPENLLHYLRFSAQRIRWVLRDMARKQRSRLLERGQRQSDNGYSEPGDTTFDPAKLALWSEFQERLDGLSEDEQQLVELLFFQECSQAETAQLLKLHVNTIQKHWMRLRLKLADWIVTRKDSL